MNHWKCTCPKCAQTSVGFNFVSRSTYYNHWSKASKAICTTTDVVQTNQTDLMQSSSSLAVGQVQRSCESSSRYYVCHCSSCRGKRVSHTTYYKHQMCEEYSVRLSNRVEIAPQSPPEDFNTGDESHVVLDERRNSLHESLEDICVHLSMSTAMTVSLDDVIASKLIQLQSLLDQSGMSIAFQDKLLKLLYGRSTAIPAYCFSEQFADNPYLEMNDTTHLSLAKLHMIGGVSWNKPKGSWAFPGSFKSLMQIYQILGMISAERWRVCTGLIGEPHAPYILQPCAWDSVETEGDSSCCDCGVSAITCPEHVGQTECSVCHTKRRDCLMFDYIPFTAVLKQIFKSTTLVNQVCTMWRSHPDWLGKTVDEVPSSISEFWHGSKVRAYQDFWNPAAEYELPVVCPNVQCRKHYRSFPTKCEELKCIENFSSETNAYEFLCSDCSTIIQQRIRRVKGCPLNIALMGHWDGWQSTRTTLRDCWTVEIVILNIGRNPSEKTLLSHPLPILFIPTSSKKLIEQKNSHLLVSFLSPFLTELENSFVDGVSVPTSALPADVVREIYPTGEIPSTITVRVILMSFAGDHPAQCKLGGLKDGGYAGCRRCTVESKLVSGNIVYPSNRKRVCYPPEKRQIANILSSAKQFAEAINDEGREMAGRVGGISFISGIWRLYDLYEFDVSLDLTFDVMHTLSLCLFKKYNESFIATLSPQDRKLVEQTLVEISKFRPRGLGHRWPKQPTKQVGSDQRQKFKLSYYKAEEHQLFIMYCILPLLRALGKSIENDVQVKLGIVLNLIARVYFVYTRKFGWTKQAFDYTRELFSTWRVLKEETQGPNGSPLEHSAGNGELLDDVVRHGHHDLFWCFPFERGVAQYNVIPTNKKTMEVSFTKYYIRRFFTSLQAVLHVERDGLQPHGRDIILLRSSLYPRVESRIDYSVSADKVLVVTNQQEAEELYKRCTHLKERYPSIKLLLQKGIGITSVKSRKAEVMPPDVQRYLRLFLESKGLLTGEKENLFHPIIKTCRGIYHDGTLYRVGDYVLVHNEEFQENMSQEDGDKFWRCKINLLFLHEFQAEMQLYFRGDWFGTEFTGDIPVTDPWSGYTLIRGPPRPHLGNGCRLVHQLRGRFLLQRTSCPNQNRYICCELEDNKIFTDFLTPGKVGCCPPWPEYGDVFICKAPNWKPGQAYSLAVVRNISHSEDVFGERKIDISWLRLHSEQNAVMIYKAGSVTTTCGWEVLLKKVTYLFHVSSFRTHSGLVIPDQWTAMVNWFREFGLTSNSLRYAQSNGFLAQYNC